MNNYSDMMDFTDIGTEDLLLFIEEIFDVKMLAKEIFELVEKENEERLNKIIKH